MTATRHNREPFSRERWTIGVFALIALALGARAVWLQVSNHDFLRDRGDARYSRVVEISAHRGMITDRRGEPLAISTPVNSVWAAPRRLQQSRSRWPELARVLGTSPEHVRTIIEPRRDREFVYLKRHVTPELADAVVKLGIEGVGLVREQRRYYPAGEVTAHVVGYTNVDDVGLEGIELAYDQVLTGVAGAKRVIKDRLGRIVENVDSLKAPQSGANLVLSLDRRIQYAAYRELKAAVLANHARGGSAIVVDTHTGEILALVNQPSFNPNSRLARSGASNRNRAITDLFEPGSVVKPITVAAALDAGAFEPSTLIDTRPGYFAIGRHVVRDIHNYGVLDVAGVIEKSSNVGATKIALALDPEVLWRAFHNVGFGVVTPLGFPGEPPGTLADYRGWREIEHATLAFGYGLSTTTVQLAQSYTVFASDGRLVPLTLLKRDAPPPAQRVFSATTAQTMRVMLQAVVNTGTGRLAMIPGYRVAGKTGTVHKSTGEGYAADRYLSLFAGFVPATRPRLVAVVVIDEPQGGEYYGGRVAAPVFAAILREALRVMNVAPDDPPTLPSQTVALDAAVRAPGARR